MGVDLVSYDQVASIVRDLGFPVLVALYFMWRDYRRDNRILELLVLISNQTKAEEGRP